VSQIKTKEGVVVSDKMRRRGGEDRARLSPPPLRAGLTPIEAAQATTRRTRPRSATGVLIEETRRCRRRSGGASVKVLSRAS